MRLVACSYLSRRSVPTDDSAYLAFIRSLPCAVCGKPKTEPHHAGTRGISQRALEKTTAELATEICESLIKIEQQLDPLCPIDRILENVTALLDKHPTLIQARAALAKARGEEPAQ